MFNRLPASVRQHVAALRILVVFTIVFGIGYPVAVTAIAQIPGLQHRANGSLIHYITHAEAKRFQPANITFDLLMPLEEELRKKIRDKKERHRIQCERGMNAWREWLVAASR